MIKREVQNQLITNDFYISRWSRNKIANILKFVMEVQGKPHEPDIVIVYVIDLLWINVQNHM